MNTNDQDPRSSARVAAERRSEPRLDASDAAEIVTVADPAANMSARVLNLSRSGMSLLLSVPLREGTPVKILFRRPTVIVGEVRYCSRVAGGYRVGVKIEATRISPNRHIDQDEFALYLSGKGLAQPELFYLRLHLSECESCSRRLREVEALTNPIRRTAAAPEA